MRHTGVGWMPLAFGVVLAGGSLLTFVWAMLRGDVTPYVPFVSISFISVSSQQPSARNLVRLAT